MKIEIKLKDPESCEGCPLLRINGMYFLAVFCDIGLRKRKQYSDNKEPIVNGTAYKRPARCKEENGL